MLRNTGIGEVPSSCPKARLREVHRGITGAGVGGGTTTSPAHSWQECQEPQKPGDTSSRGISSPVPSLAGQLAEEECLHGPAHITRQGQETWIGDGKA